MAAFIQWATSFRSREVAPRVTWVCGDDLVLVEEVVSKTIKLANVSPLNYETFTVGEVRESTIWAGLYKISMDVGQPTLTVVRDVQKLSTWEPLELYLKIKREGTGYVIFVSTETDFPREKPKYDQKLGDLKDHIRQIQNKGVIVRCITPTEEDLVKWAKAKLPGVADAVILKLVQRSGHNTKVIRDTCVKLEHFKPSAVSVRVVEAMVTPTAIDELSDCLVAGDKKSALLAPADLSEIVSLIRLMDSRLDLLHSLYTAQLNSMSVKDMMSKYKLSDFLIRKYLPYAKQYDASRRERLKKTLAALEEQAMSGAREGLIEALVALW